MTHEELENLITQSLDGLLASDQQEALDAELARNPAARQIRDQYLALDNALTSAPLPNLDFDLLGEQISRAIDDADAPAPVSIFPVWSRWSTGIAAAACILLAFTIWGHRETPTPMAISPTQGSSQVAIMNAGAPINSQPVAFVSVGPQPGQSKIDLPAREALTTPRSAVAIDSAAPAAQDTERPLY